MNIVKLFEFALQKCAIRLEKRNKVQKLKQWRTLVSTHVQKKSISATCE